MDSQPCTNCFPDPELGKTRYIEAREVARDLSYKINNTTGYDVVLDRSGVNGVYNIIRRIGSNKTDAELNQALAEINRRKALFDRKLDQGDMYLSVLNRHNCPIVKNAAIETLSYREDAHNFFIDRCLSSPYLNGRVVREVRSRRDI